MSEDLIITHVVAMSERGVIGLDGKLPWHLPSDLKLFRALTLRKPVIMGRKTFQSIGSPLAERDNIVLTRGDHFSVEGVIYVKSLDEALSTARCLAEQRMSDEIAVIGGQEIYELTLPVCRRLHLNLIKDKSQIEGDAFYPYGASWLNPAARPAGWQENKRQKFPRPPGESHDTEYIRFDKTET